MKVDSDFFLRKYKRKLSRNEELKNYKNGAFADNYFVLFGSPYFIIVQHY